MNSRASPRGSSVGQHSREEGERGGEISINQNIVGFAVSDSDRSGSEARGFASVEFVLSSASARRPFSPACVHESSWELTTHGKVTPHFPLNVDVPLLCLTSERLSPSDRLERGERPTARCVANRRPCRIAFHLHEGLAIAVIHFLPPLLRGRGDHIKGHWTLYSVASAIKRIHLHQLPPSCVRVLLGRGREWRHCISCNAPATAVSTLRRLPQQKKSASSSQMKDARVTRRGRMTDKEVIRCIHAKQ